MSDATKHVDAAKPDETPPAAPVDRPDYGAIGATIFGLVVAWVALAAIPGALPVNAADDAQRVVVIAVGLATLVAVIMIFITWVASGSLREESARIGTWSARLATALAALQVVMVLLVPMDWPLRMQALGVGLLVILGCALLAMAGARTGDGLITGLRLSNISILASVLALGLIGAYLLMMSRLFGLVPESDDDAWLRYTELRTGIEALAFAAAGALLGNTVQRQVTNQVQDQLEAADDAAEELDKGLEDVKSEVEAGRLVAVEPDTMAAEIEGALLAQADQFRERSVLVNRRHKIVTAIAVPATETMARVRERQARARAMRRRRP